MKLKFQLLGLVLITALFFVGCPNPVDTVPTESMPQVEIPIIFDSYPEGDGGPVSIIVICATEDVQIKYTTDGSTPSSTVGYTSLGAITIYETCTLKVVAVKSGMRDSAVVSEAYTVTKTAKPQFNHNSGEYPSALDVVITCGTPGSEIWYTVDGSTPSNTNGQKYSSSIEVNEPKTIKAIAYKNGMADSQVSTASYSFSFPLTLVDNQWKTGSINSGKVQWYTFDAIAGERYELMWDDSKEGSTAYTCDIKVTAYRQNQIESYFYATDSGYSTPKVITASATEKVYIKVEGYSSSSSSGTFAIKYKNIPAIQLSDDVWADGTISYSGDKTWYYFEAVAGEIYEIQWDDSKAGSGSKTCDVQLTAYRANKTTNYFYGVDSGYSSPQTIKALASERIYICVEGYSSSSTGTFAVKIKNVKAVSLSNDQWTIDTIAYASAEKWYYFDATAGVSYEIKWDDKYSGSGTYTGDVTVSAYNQNKTISYFDNVDTGFGSPKIITPTVNERVYIKVKGYSSSTGTFAVKFRSIQFSSLTNNQWTAGTIDNLGNDVWFSFDAQAGARYELMWDDSKEGSGSYTGDVGVVAFKSDRMSYYFTFADSGYNSPKIITASATEKVYVKVSGYTVSSTGTFALKYKKLASHVVNPYNSVQSGVSEEFAPNESWTFMVYLDADNNLENAGIADFNEMIEGLNGLNNPNIKVVVVIDRTPGYSADYLGESADWTGARIYEMKQDGTYAKQTNGWFTDGAEINMGDPNTLSSFINYCKTNYSSEHYSLILWNHGGGARSKTGGANDKLVKAICWDDTNSGDCLYLDELQQVLMSHFNVSNKLDFIGFDACLMGTVEVAYELRDIASVMAGSMANEWGNGWDYNVFFKGMTQGSNNDPKELGKLVVKMYHDSTQSQSAQTMAAVDLTQISTIKPLIDNLAVAIYQENMKSEMEVLRDFTYHFYTTDEESVAYPYYDLCDLACQIIGNSNVFSANLVSSAEAVLAALQNVILASYAGSDFGNYYGTGTSVKRGLSIFFSRGNLLYSGNSHYRYQWWYTNQNTNSWNSGFYYGLIDFADSDTDGTVETWRELMEAWYDPAPSNYTPGNW